MSAATLDAYLSTIPVREHPTRREWAALDNDVFQARVGPEMERLAVLLEGNGDDKLGLVHMVEDMYETQARQRRWYNLRVSDLARLIGVAIAGFLSRGPVS